MTRALLSWMVMLLGAALAACSGSGGDPAADAAPEADVASPADVPVDAAADAVGKDTADVPPDLSADADAVADVTPPSTWTIAAEGAPPATDLWVRATAGAVDAATGTLTVNLETSAFSELLGLSFHLAVDPALAEVAGVTRVYQPTASGSTAWTLVARAGAADVQGALAVRRSGESGFGGGSSPLSGSLAEATVLYQVQLRLKQPGTLTVALDLSDTVAVAPDWTTRPLERLGLTVTSAKEVAE